MQNVLSGNHPDQRSFMLFMGISLAGHAAVFLFMILFSGFPGCDSRTVPEGVIRVDLVSLPDTGDGRPAPPAAASRSSAPKPAAAKAPLFEKPAQGPEPAVSVSDKKRSDRVKTSLKKKTFDSQQILQDALDSLKEKVDKKETPDPLSEALSRLRRQVDEEGAGGGGKAGGQGAPRDRLTALDIYKLEIRYHILENWVYSRQLAGKDQDLKAAIGITIAADGRITDIWYDGRSGNRYFDESAYKAVLKSDPLPALPKGYETYTVGLEFTPSDIPDGQGQ